MKAECGIHEMISEANGEKWFQRYAEVDDKLKGDAPESNPSTDDVTGAGVYSSNPDAEGAVTEYNIVNAWQANYVRGVCSVDGNLLIAPTPWSDEACFKDFYATREGATVLDLGCNTGKNMERAQRYGGQGTDVYGLEYSLDSVEIARATWVNLRSRHDGEERVFQGDASANWVDAHAWEGKFTVVQCTQWCST